MLWKTRSGAEFTEFITKDILHYLILISVKTKSRHKSDRELPDAEPPVFEPQVGSGRTSAMRGRECVSVQGKAVK
jgi:hypothetical protein